MDSIWRQQSLECTLVFLVLLKEVSNKLPPGSLCLLFCPPERGKECGMQKRDHTVMVNQEKRGLQELFVSLENTTTTNKCEMIYVITF